MKKRARGFSLLAILWFAGLFMVIVTGTLSVVEGSRSRLVAHKNRQVAAQMAASGLEYARTMLASRQWPASAASSPTGAPSFTSPDLEGGTFSVQVVAQAGQRRIVSEGRAAGVTSRLEQVIP